MSDRLKKLGEDRHQRCRFGLLTEAWYGDGNPEGWEPTVLPICTFKVPEPCPPALLRQWGGSIDLVRDCAVCPAFAEVRADQQEGAAGEA